jgi:hypothetical protein
VYQNKKESKKKRGLEQAPTTLQKAPFLSRWDSALFLGYVGLGFWSFAHRD